MEYEIKSQRKGDSNVERSDCSNDGRLYYHDGHHQISNDATTRIPDITKTKEKENEMKWKVVIALLFTIGLTFFSGPAIEDADAPPQVETLVAAEGMIPDGEAWNCRSLTEREVDGLDVSVDYKYSASSNEKVEIDWGDGTVVVLPSGSNSGGKTHRYAAGGTYQIQLRVYNESGSEFRSCDIFVTVTPPEPQVEYEIHELAVCDKEPNEIEIRVHNLSSVPLIVKGELYAQPYGGEKKTISSVPPQYQEIPPDGWGGPEERLENHYSYFDGEVWGWVEIYTLDGTLLERYEMERQEPDGNPCGERPTPAPTLTPTETPTPTPTEVPTEEPTPTPAPTEEPQVEYEIHELAVCDKEPNEVEIRVHNLGVPILVKGELWAQPYGGDAKRIALVREIDWYTVTGGWNGPEERLENHYSYFDGEVWGWVEIYTLDGTLLERYEMERQEPDGNPCGDKPTPTPTPTSTPPPPPPTAVCKFTEATMTWNEDELIIIGEIEGFGVEWKITDKRGNEVKSGNGDHGTFLIKKEWEDPNDHEDRYTGWIKGYDGEWRTSSDCDFQPVLSCPECGFPVYEVFGDNSNTPEPEDGDQLVFWADHCSVGPCNSLVLTTEVLYRSIGNNFQLPYKGEKITGTPVSRVPGDVFEAKFPFTWLEDNQDFILLDENGKRIRDEESHGPNGVEKYIACSLTVGLVDIDCDATAYHTDPQTVWDWQWAIIREWKLLDNKQSSWDQVAEWARVLRDEGELSLLDLDQYGSHKPIDLSALDNLLAPCDADATDSNTSNTDLQLEDLTT